MAYCCKVSPQDDWRNKPFVGLFHESENASARCLEMTAARSMRRQVCDLSDQCVHYLRYDILAGRETLNVSENICRQKIELGLRCQTAEGFDRRGIVTLASTPFHLLSDKLVVRLRKNRKSQGSVGTRVVHIRNKHPFAKTGR